MITIYPTTESRHFYEQNGISFQEGNGIFNTAPHAETQRDVYTVPAGKRALIMTIDIGLRRRSVATALSTASVFLRYSGQVIYKAIIQVWHYNNTIFSEVSKTIGCAFFLNEGDTIEVMTVDNSTGGTMDFYCNFTVLEFDA